MQKVYISQLCAILILGASANVHAYDVWELSAGNADRIPHQKFKDAWAEAGKKLGYPKGTSGSQNSSTTISVEWFNPSWTSAEFYNWQKFDNNMKLYISGVVAMQKGESVSLAAENFKSITLGYYQCMNTLSNYQKFLMDRGVRVSGSIKDNFVLCGMGKI